MSGRAEVGVDEDSEIPDDGNGGIDEPATESGSVGSRDNRRAEAHHITSVLLAFNWSRLEHIQLATWSMQRVTSDASVDVLAAEQEPKI